MKNIRNRLPLLIAFLVAVAFIVIIAISYTGLHNRLSKAETMSQPPLAVKTVVCNSGSLTKIVPALATIKSAATLQIKSEVAGKITFLPFREGDRVKAGDLLAVIDSREQTALLEAAVSKSKGADSQIQSLMASLNSLKGQKKAIESNLRFTKSDLRRNENLYNADAISARALENTRNRIAEAQSRLDTINAQIQAQINQIEASKSQKEATEKEVEVWQVRKGYTEIRAVVDGIVSARMQEEGNQTMPGATILVIEDTSRGKLVARFPQNLLGKIRSGQKLLLNDFPDFPFKISRIYPTLDRFRQFTVEALPAESNQFFELQGIKFDMQMPANLIISKANGTIVPFDAVFVNFISPESAYIFVIKENQAVRRSLTPLLTNERGDCVFSDSDLTAGSVVARGAYLENVRLADSFQVEVLK
jgi:multidrug efflux pump subunit AcrA (membrane-fusion protein)